MIAGLSGVPVLTVEKGDQLFKPVLRSFIFFFFSVDESVSFKVLITERKETYIKHNSCQMIPLSWISTVIFLLEATADCCLFASVNNSQQKKIFDIETEFLIIPVLAHAKYNKVNITYLSGSFLLFFSLNWLCSSLLNCHPIHRFWQYHFWPQMTVLNFLSFSISYFRVVSCPQEKMLSGAGISYWTYFIMA